MSDMPDDKPPATDGDDKWAPKDKPNDKIVSPWGTPPSGSNDKPQPAKPVNPFGPKGTQRPPRADSNPATGNKNSIQHPAAPKPPELEALLQRGRDRLTGIVDKVGNRQNLRPALTLPPHRVLGAVLAMIVTIWLTSGFYRVEEGQLGVVLRFGQVNRTAQPGLRYHLPYPFETALTPNVTFENRIEVGFRSNANGTATGSGTAATDEQAIPEESLMLTADQNIIDLNFAVTWIVKDARQFLFEIRDPEITVKRAAESAMREVIGQTDIQSALTDARDQIQQDTKTQLQQILDQYRSGIEIVRVELLRVNPPAPVVDAFNDVQRADADRARVQNEAESYRNKIIPEARGEAERLRNEAEGYRQQVVNAATGEASRFVAVEAAYDGNRQVTMQRLYLETMESVLRDKRKLVIDASHGMLPYLALTQPWGNTAPPPLPEPTAPAATIMKAGVQ